MLENIKSSSDWKPWMNNFYSRHMMSSPNDFQRNTASEVFVLFVRIYHEEKSEMFTLRDIRNGTKIYEVKAELELLCGIPICLMKMHSVHEKAFQDDDILSLRKNVSFGDTIRMQFNESWNDVFNDVWKGSITNLGSSIRASMREFVSDKSEEHLTDTNEDQNNLIAKAFFIACRRGQEKMCRMLLKYGFNANFATSLGNTCLHVASSCGNLSIVQLLVANGSNVRTRNILGQLPLEIAVRKGHFDCARWLWLNQWSVVINEKNSIVKPSKIEQEKSYDLHLKSEMLEKRRPISANLVKTTSSDLNPNSGNSLKAQESWKRPHTAFYSRQLTMLNSKLVPKVISNSPKVSRSNVRSKHEVTLNGQRSNKTASILAYFATTKSHHRSIPGRSVRFDGRVVSSTPSWTKRNIITDTEQALFRSSSVEKPALAVKKKVSFDVYVSPQNYCDDSSNKSKRKIVEFEECCDKSDLVLKESIDENVAVTSSLPKPLLLPFSPGEDQNKWEKSSKVSQESAIHLAIPKAEYESDSASKSSNEQKMTSIKRGEEYDDDYRDSKHADKGKANFSSAFPNGANGNSKNGKTSQLFDNLGNKRHLNSSDRLNYFPNKHKQTDSRKINYEFTHLGYAKEAPISATSLARKENKLNDSPKRINFRTSVEIESRKLSESQRSPRVFKYDITSGESFSTESTTHDNDQKNGQMKNNVSIVLNHENSQRQAVKDATEYVSTSASSENQSNKENIFTSAEQHANGSKHEKLKHSLSPPPKRRSFRKSIESSASVRITPKPKRNSDEAEKMTVPNFAEEERIERNRKAFEAWLMKKRKAMERRRERENFEDNRQPSPKVSSGITFDEWIRMKNEEAEGVQDSWRNDLETEKTRKREIRFQKTFEAWAKEKREAQRLLAEKQKHEEERKKQREEEEEAKRKIEYEKKIQEWIKKKEELKKIELERKREVEISNLETASAEYQEWRSKPRVKSFNEWMKAKEEKLKQEREAKAEDERLKQKEYEMQKMRNRLAKEKFRLWVRKKDQRKLENTRVALKKVLSKKKVKNYSLLPSQEKQNVETDAASIEYSEDGKESSDYLSESDQEEFFQISVQITRKSKDSLV